MLIKFQDPSVLVDTVSDNAGFYVIRCQSDSPLVWSCLKQILAFYTFWLLQSYWIQHALSTIMLRIWANIHTSATYLHGKMALMTDVKIS